MSRPISLPSFVATVSTLYSPAWPVANQCPLASSPCGKSWTGSGLAASTGSIAVDGRLVLGADDRLVLGVAGGGGQVEPLADGDPAAIEA